MTYGEKLVGLSFNPSALTTVNECKQRFAEQIDQMYELAFEEESIDSPVKQALISRAQMLCLEAQMMCVKALTFKG